MTSEPIQDPKLLLRHAIRLSTRSKFKQTMGELRSMASAMAAKKLIADEEEYFRGLVAEHFYAQRDEAVKLFGVEQAASLMDIYQRVHGDPESPR